MTGLIGWWPLHENTGSTARDLSGNGNHGTFNNGVTQGVAGKGGLTAYTFDGSSGYIDTGVQSVETPFTFCTWIRPKDENYHSIWDNYTNSSSDIEFTADSNLYGFVDGYGKPAVTASNVIQKNSWQHIGLTVTDKQVFLHHNGNNYASGEISSGTKTFDSGQPFYLASYPGSDGGSGDGQFFNGIINGVRLYNRALSPEEIQTLYEWGSGDYTDRSYHDGSDPGAVSRWEFDGNVADSWGSNEGTDNTSVGYTSDAIRGQAKKFDGQDDYVEVSESATLDITDTISISAWIKTPKKQNRAAIIEKGGFDTYWLQKQTSDQLRFGIRDSGTAYYVDTDPSDWKQNNWTHVIGTFDGNQLEIYVNGALKNSNSHIGTIDTDDDPCQIGNSFGFDRAFEGKIEDVRIYNRALEPHEVFQLYQWGTRGRDMRKLTVKARGGQ